jgi:hypothetical protein
MQDRRKHPRDYADSTIHLHLAEGHLIVNASIVDISEKGALVTFIAPEKIESLSEGMPVKFTFHLATGAISGSGSIAWLKKHKQQLGLRFEQIESGSANLQAFLSNDLI